MLAYLGFSSTEELVEAIIPPSIRLERPLSLPSGESEKRLLDRLREIEKLNRVARSFVGMGYHDTITPGVIRRNVLENPGWYTQYTPYQSEISQGRLEALLNFQTMCIDLTGLPVANASLLDEGTAAAEAMILLASAAHGRRTFMVAEDCHPQTIEVLRTRARPLGIRIDRRAVEDFEPHDDVFGALLQYPATDGLLRDHAALAQSLHESGAHLAVAVDLLAMTLVEPPGAWGADIAVGSSQRFGVPLGFGGPHAAFMTASEAFKRKMPGRIIGVSVDAEGRTALRMALQTREQHIRRERATSNICTAQVLLAIMASMYAVYHGPAGLRAIAERVRELASVLARGLARLGHEVVHADFFDTLRVRPLGVSSSSVLERARAGGINLRDFGDGSIGVALDETVGPTDLDDVFAAFAGEAGTGFDARTLASRTEVPPLPPKLRRTSPYLEHPVFNSYRSETAMLRYIHRLESRDLALNTSMIPLGSCTMKLNATSEMEALTWTGFSRIHPFAPRDQTRGYQAVMDDLETWLGEITGLEAVSLQPNSGAQGEYTGLLVIRAYHDDRGQPERDVCLIPSSAHGTNPASAVMAGMDVRIVRVDESGAIDLGHLEELAVEFAERLAALMITYPSTHGVFEEDVEEVCRIVHTHGGLVYLDGANLNAQVGLARPGDYGADVCHVNLHKTFAIPHGGGGPGMGPICASRELREFLPRHPLADVGGSKGIGPVSSAPWGSASILIISWAYIALLGRHGVARASEVAILAANYMAKRLERYYDVLYRGRGGCVAHEFILDLRKLRKSCGITEEDVAKRLMDYGFHAPTMSWPVPGTIMVEPTESEPKDELDRFCDALISIRAEIEQVELGVADPEDNLLRNAPHTAQSVVRDDWGHPYSREQAVFPAPWTREHKYWPPVARVDNAFGDRNLVCACPPVEAYGRT